MLIDDASAGSRSVVSITPQSPLKTREEGSTMGSNHELGSVPNCGHNISNVAKPKASSAKTSTSLIKGRSGLPTVLAQ